MTMQKRQRGVILKYEGLQKLQNAKNELEIQNNHGQKYTFEQLSELTELDICTVKKVFYCSQGVDIRTLERIFITFNLKLTSTEYSTSIVNKQFDLEEAISTEAFYGRTEELASLEESILRDRCRLVGILGMGGIGKTTLSVKFAKQVQDKFEYVIWRSLREAPPVQDILANLIQSLSSDEEIEAYLPESLRERILQLLDYLRNYRCLVILDNMESILSSGTRAGIYQEGYEGYGELLKVVGEATHKSCLVLTSREKPKEVASLEGKALPIRSLQLSGLNIMEGQELFNSKGLCVAKDKWTQMIDFYAGNPLALKIISTTIQDVFLGNINEFLQHDSTVFGDINDVLEQQFNRLSSLEKNIVYWLAINREPMEISELQEDIVLPIPQSKLLEALESLRRRSLVEISQEAKLYSPEIFGVSELSTNWRSSSIFVLQPVLMEYVTEKLVAEVCSEIFTGEAVLYKSHALMKANAKDRIKEAQVRFILKPVIDGLLVIFGSIGCIEQHLNKTLEKLRDKSPLEAGYAAGNIINLFCQMSTNLRGYDFSYLTVWQACLKSAQLQEVNFAHADLAKSVFAETFGSVLSTVFSPDGTLLAICDIHGEIRLYQVKDGKLLLTCKGHKNFVTSVAFSPDGKTLASSSIDSTIKLWNVNTGQCQKTLQAHYREVGSVAFNLQGNMLVSASNDRTVKLWSVSTGECLKTFRGHSNNVLSATFTPDGLMLASGSDDNTIRLWDVNTNKCKTIFDGHSGGIQTIGISPDGLMLASGSDDNTIRLWDINTGKCKRIFYGHDNAVCHITFNPQGDTIASGGRDQTVRLWSISTGECLKILEGHTDWVFSVTFNPQGDMLASGSQDQTMKLWSINSGECLKTFQGHSNQVLSLAFSPDSKTLASGSSDSSMRLWDVCTGNCLRIFQKHDVAVRSVAFCPDAQTLASGSHDSLVRLWDISTNKCIRTFEGHTAAVWSVAFSPNCQTLASASDDQTIRLWDFDTGQALGTFQGHNTSVWSVAFNPSGKILASGGFDYLVKLWDVSTCQCLRTLEGHTSWVWSVAWSPNGEILASTSADGTLRLWSVITGECVRILQTNTSWLYSVVFSPDSQTVASCSQDYTVKLWDVSTGECLKNLQGHTGRVWSIAWSPDNQTLASSSEDETIKLWDITTSKCLKTLQLEKPYNQMKIIGVKGLTEAAIASLKKLEAVER
jgi:WD40 repeat protein